MSGSPRAPGLKWSLPLSLQIREMASLAPWRAAKRTSIPIWTSLSNSSPAFHPGLRWFDLEEDLERLLGRPVDLSQKSLLKPRVRQAALRQAVILYAA